MSDNLQGVNDDLASTLCSCSTIDCEDSLNRIKLLEVEKDKTNLAFQLILAKLDLVGGFLIRVIMNLCSVCF
ncbi:unnamed protein product [Meloidogyne enterolobii]|uniref:Uncharacterized protein n=1 Tax=Meloidogyne enterolobii TaxID=390850 RepID=A0ACB0ZH49_MELEN